MRNPANLFSILFAISFIFIAIHVNAAGAYPDAPDLSYTINGNQVTIKTKLKVIQGGTSYYTTDEQSVGFFYRLDSNSVNDGHSYFWDTIIFAPNTEISTTIMLPKGEYSLVCYQTRKGGPIRPTGKLVINVTATNTNTFPTVNKTNNPILLTPSWNVFTDPSYTSTLEVHNTYNNTAFPGDAWLFVGLSVGSLSSTFTLNDIFLDYDKDKMTYHGAIDNNYESISTFPSGWLNVNSITDIPGSKGNLKTVLNTSNAQRERNILLIFKYKSTADVRDTIATFIAYALDGITPVFHDTLRLGVHGKPHDPNYLEVDKKALCPCQDDEYLVYKVNFQNKGTAPATKVTVKLENYSGSLYPNTISVLSNNSALKNTFLKNAPVNHSKTYNNTLFTIYPINLPGTGQSYPYWQTEDFFKFTIKKKDCMPLGSAIEPKVTIEFYDGKGDSMGGIQTNLERTDIDFVECSGASPACEGKCNKKKCCLLRIFRPRNRSKN